MKFGRFESAGLKPLGSGDQKNVFVDPGNEKRVVSEIKKEAEKDTPRQLKGRYYLTKIAHLLLPENIPDIYQAGESHEGGQNVYAERISHTAGHALIQKARQEGGDEAAALKISVKELGRGAWDLDLELERIGLGFNVDDKNIANYTKNEKGSVYYLETFKPWRVDDFDKNELKVLFEEEDMRDAIDGLSDQETKEKCLKYLERILELMTEEEKELRERREASLQECGPYVEELEGILAPLLTAESLTLLHSIETEEEAMASLERTFARKARVPILKKLQFLEEKTTNVTDEQCADLRQKYKILDRAIGTVNGGKVDHTR